MYSIMNNRLKGHFSGVTQIDKTMCNTLKIQSTKNFQSAHNSCNTQPSVHSRHCYLERSSHFTRLCKASFAVTMLAGNRKGHSRRVFEAINLLNKRWIPSPLRRRQPPRIVRAQYYNRLGRTRAPFSTLFQPYLVLSTQSLLSLSFRQCHVGRTFRIIRRGAAATLCY